MASNTDSKDTKFNQLIVQQMIEHLVYEPSDATDAWKDELVKLFTKKSIGEVTLYVEGSQTVSVLKALVMQKIARTHHFTATEPSELKCDDLPIAGVTAAGKMVTTYASTLNKLKLTPKGVFEVFAGAKRSGKDPIFEFAPWVGFVLHAKLRGLSASDTIASFVKSEYGVHIDPDYVPAIEELLVYLELCVVKSGAQSIDVAADIVARYQSAIDRAMVATIDPSVEIAHPITSVSVNDAKHVREQTAAGVAVVVQAASVDAKSANMVVPAASVDAKSVNVVAQPDSLDAKRTPSEWIEYDSLHDQTRWKQVGNIQALPFQPISRSSASRTATPGQYWSSALQHDQELMRCIDCNLEHYSDHALTLERAATQYRAGVAELKRKKTALALRLTQPYTTVPPNNTS